MSVIKEKNLIRKINNSHIVWFEESNSWIQLKEPAWFVYRRLLSGETTADISQKIARRYHLNGSISHSFVEEISSLIQKLNTKRSYSQGFRPGPEVKSPDTFYSKRAYIFNRKKIEICYGSHLLEYMIHPSFAHLEIIEESKPHYRIEAFSIKSLYILKSQNNAWQESDANRLKRRLFIELTGLIYNKSSHDWLSLIHGSCVSNEKESIILTTGSGSGKSTLAALLCSRGLKFVSDDYIPIDARFCRSYPFPAALSVKDGSYPVLQPIYKELNDAKIFHFKGTNKTVRYLIFPTEATFYRPTPVKKLIFVKYDASGTTTFRKVPVPEAMLRFNEEAWVSHSPAHARKFINWFPQLECYELEYSDNHKALEYILNLIK